MRLADIGPSLRLSEDEESGALGDALRSSTLQYVSCDVRKPDTLISGQRCCSNCCIMRGTLVPEIL